MIVALYKNLNCCSVVENEPLNGVEVLSSTHIPEFRQLEYSGNSSTCTSWKLVNNLNLILPWWKLVNTHIVETRQHSIPRKMT